MMKYLFPISIGTGLIINFLIRKLIINQYFDKSMLFVGLGIFLCLIIIGFDGEFKNDK